MAKKIFYKPADAAVAYTEVEIAELEKKLIAVYSEAEADIQKKMDDFTAKYQKQDLIYQKQLKEGLITQADYDDWKKGRVFVGKQWAAKKDEIAAVLHNSNKISTSMINMSAFDVFGENSNYMAYTMEHTAGVNFGFQVYNTDAVAQLIKDDPELLPKWKVDQKKDYDWNRKNLNNAITQGIIQGESLSKISKRVSSSLAGKNENLMNTFAKTGMTQAQNSGRLERMEKGKALGIDVKKKWVATLDGRTRYAHRELDGQIVDTDEDFKTEGYTIAYPGDPQAHPSLVYNCRCAITSSFDKYPSKYQRYDNIDGVPIDGMTYREWEEAKGRTVKSKPSTDFISLDNDDNFGKPGIYDVYRAGDIFESPLGFLSFGMDEKQSLDYVALHNNAAIKEYAIDIRNPLYVKGTSFDDIQDELARKYTGKSILDDDLSLDEIRLIMNNACEEIEKEGYDSIVQVVENRITGTKKYEVGVLNGHLDTIRLKSDYLDDINGVKPAKKSTTVVNGKDISSTWKRRVDEFNFEIEDVINAQGFDGKPRVVSAKEFDKYVKEVNNGKGFIAQRAYSAPNQETLDAYRDQLYNGKWYVDCSNGGAAHGKGMYCVGNERGMVSEKMNDTMRSYGSSEFANIETFTIDKSAKFINEEDIESLHSKLAISEAEKYLSKYNFTDDELRFISAYRGVNSQDASFVGEFISNEKTSNRAMEIMKELSTNKELLNDTNDMFNDYLDIISDQSNVAVLFGYDGIKCRGGQDYYVILNRTKCIFKGE